MLNSCVVLRKSVTSILATLLFVLALHATTGCRKSSGGGQRAPSVAAPSTIEVALGSRADFMLSASDVSGKRLPAMLEPLPLPNGVSFDPVTGKGSFEPDATQVGRLTFFAVAIGEAAVTRRPIAVTVTERQPGSGTELSGIVLDSDTRVPLVGATVIVPGTSLPVVKTDSEGRFVIAQIPDGARVVDIDGGPAGGWTFVAEDIELLLGHPLYKDQANSVHRPIYLPKLGPSAGTVEKDKDSVLTNKEGVELRVTKGSAQTASGAFSGAMYMPRVDRNFTPAALPDTLEPADVFAIQPAGLTFNPPAAIKLPNSNGLADGSEVNIWSINPETGTFHVVATATAQGQFIVSKPGEGIRNSSWHFAESSGPDGDNSNNPDRNDNPNRCTQEGASRVTLHTGNLSEEHQLVTYRSQGVERGVTLVHVGRSACPTPLVAADIELHRRFASPKAFSSTIALGGLKVPGEHFFESPGTTNRAPQRVARLFDAALLPTGHYPYTLRVTSHYESSRVSSNFSGGLFVHNNMRSPFGCGWSMVDLERLRIQVDGTAVLDMGNGQLLAFIPGAGALDYRDFAELGDLQLNGDAARLQNPVTWNGQRVLRLNASNGAGSTFYRRQVPLTEQGTPVDLHAAFSFRLSDPSGISDSDGPGADGITFAIARSPSALGRTGVSLGYEGIGKSVAIEFDTYQNGEKNDPNGNHVGINRGGSARSMATVTHSKRFNDGDVWFVWVDYSGAAKKLEVRFSLSSVRPAKANLTADIDLRTELGQPEAYAGFTAASASGQNKHDILSWRMSWAVPNPGPERRFSSPRGEFSKLTQLADGSFKRELTDGSQVLFDATGLQTRRIDRNGNATVYAYDNRERLITVTDPVGLATTLRYGNDGLLDEIGSPGSAATRFEHQGMDLIAIVDPDGSKRQFGYDQQHRLTKQVGKRGFETTYEYEAGSVLKRARWSTSGNSRSYSISRAAGAMLDVTKTSLTSPSKLVRSASVKETTLTDRRGKVAKVSTGKLGGITKLVNQVGDTSTWDRNSDGQVVKFVSPRGRVDERSYDSVGNLTQLVEAKGSREVRTIRYRYEPERSWLIARTDGDGFTTTFSRDTEGNVKVMEHPDSKQKLFAYTPTGQIEKATDENGNETTYSYNKRGNLESTTNALGEVTRLERDGRGNILRRIIGVGTSEQRTESFSYDALNRTKTSTDGAGGTTLFTYDTRGNLTVTKLPTGEETRREYDARQRLVKLVDQIQGVSTFTYDEEDNLRSRTDARNLTTSFEYDDAGRTEKVTDAAGGVETYTYDKSGNVETFTNARTKVTRFTYDLLERRLSMRTPMGRLRQWSYDRRDNLTEYTQPNGAIVHRYNERSMRMQTAVPAVVGSYISYVITRRYDGVGNLRFVTDEDTRVERTYDALNRTKEEKTLTGGLQPVTTLTSHYNAVGDRTRLVDSSGTTHSYSYDGAGRLTSASTPAVGNVSFSYDVSGRLQTTTYPNGIVGAHTYAQGRLTNIGHRAAGKSPVLDLAYETGPSGNFDAITDDGSRRSYGYDKIDRLTSATGTPVESYTYDPVGNRTSSHLSSTHEHNDDNQLLRDSTYSYVYDPNGNQATRTKLPTGPVDNLQWDGKSQLVMVQGKATYRYDGLGRRVEKKLSDGTIRRYVYDKNEALLEFDGQNRLVARYTHGKQVDQHLAMERGGKAYYYHADHLGSVRRLTDNTGAVAASYRYDAYGQVSDRAGSLENPYLYGGREEAEGAGLYYYRARWYSPFTGSFIGEDPYFFYGSGPNWYQYAKASPLVYVDRYGLRPIRNESGVDVTASGNVGPGSGSGPQVLVVVPPDGVTYGPGNPLNGIEDFDGVDVNGDGAVDIEGGTEKWRDWPWAGCLVITCDKGSPKGKCNINVK